MTVSESLILASSKLKAVKIPSFRIDSELLLAHTFKQSREWLIAHPEYELSERETKRFTEYINRRIDREPVCYITNHIEFYGIDFYVDNRVLSPRVETELIVEQAIKNTPKNSKLIDIGTGSGAIAITIAKHRPDLKITATEVSKGALEVARLNAKNILGTNHTIKFIEADIWNNISDSYQVVVTNLPYVSEDNKPAMLPEVQKEPSIALFGGPGDGLDLYHRFYLDLPKYIKKDSLVYHESDPWQHQVLIQLAQQAGLTPILEDYLILGFKSA